MLCLLSRDFLRACINTCSHAWSTDRDVLVALYHATDGDNWRDSDNWNSQLAFRRADRHLVWCHHG